ncbi:MAG: ABC transporter substrate-binding protein [Thermoleophilaceae bacterium]|jgi:NitT/TauT family transport system substrate-binding protein/putative hydroxymethylpyrimidine transport system substrate-binding protein
MRKSLMSLLLVAVALAGCGAGDDGRADQTGSRPVTLALDFQPNAVHAGVYTATAEGLDRERGLALTVRAPSASTDSLKLLAAGRADLAIVDIHDLGLAREGGADVVGVGAIVQRPLAAVIAGPEVRRPRDLEGRRVGVTGLPSDDAVLTAVVAADGGDPDSVRRTTIGFSAVPSLVAGRVDAVVTFWNAEGVALRERGVRTREFRVDEFGAPRYPELVLATTGETLRARPGLVRDTIAALAAGTQQALADLPASADRIAQASDGDAALVTAQLEAVAPALEPPLELDRAALKRWARFDARFGILESPPEVEAAFPLLR